MANEQTFSLDDLEDMDWTYLETDGLDQEDNEPAAPGIFDSALGYRLATILPGKERRGLPDDGTGDLMAAAPRLAAFTAWALPILRKLRHLAASQTETEGVFRMMVEAAEAALEEARVTAPPLVDDEEPLLLVNPNCPGSGKQVSALCADAKCDICGVTFRQNDGSTSGLNMWSLPSHAPGLRRGDPS